MEGRGSLSLLRRDDAPSIASTNSWHHTLPAPNESTRLSFTSVDGIHNDCSQPHNNGGVYRHTQTGIFRSLSMPSLTSISASSTASHPSLTEASPTTKESSEKKQWNCAVASGFADSGTTVSSEQGDPRESESTLHPSTRVRRPGSGCSRH